MYCIDTQYAVSWMNWFVPPEEFYKNFCSVQLWVDENKITTYVPIDCPSEVIISSKERFKNPDFVVIYFKNTGNEDMFIEKTRVHTEIHAKFCARKLIPGSEIYIAKVHVK